MQAQTKRKGFNAAEARVADTGADQFFDPKRGVPKAEAALLSTARPSKKAGRYGSHVVQNLRHCVSEQKLFNFKAA